MGGALNVSYCTLINCSIANNTAYSNGGGGGVEISSGFSNFYNCSFYNNLADRGGAIRNHSTSGTTILKNCIFWGNISRLSDVDINNYWALSTTSVTNTLLQRSLSSYTSGFPNIATGNNLFAQDPKFVDAANNNLALQICSPAINAGSGNTATNANTNVTTTIITDINGATRVQNGIIDIGAYENGANSNSPICSGKTINLFSSGGTSYSWYGPNGFTSTLQNPSLGNTSSAANGIYTVSITNGSCSTVTTTATTNVTVNALPTPLASSNSPICTGNSLNLSASGGTSYIWSGPSNFSSTLQNPSISNVGASSSGIYFVIVANANGCVATATTNVTVNPLAIAGSNSPICEGNTLNLSASNGISYDWIGPNSFSSIDQNPSIPNSITSLSGIYTVSVTNNLGCIETSTVVVTVNSLPSIPTITPPANSIICSPNTLTLTATGCAGIVTWLNNATGTSLTISAVDTYSISANCTQNGCISEQSSTISGLEIKAKPSPPTIIPPENLSVCSPTTLTLTATGCAGIVAWSNNATGTILTISEVGTYSISANCTQNSCISEQSSTVSGLEINAKPNPPTIISPEILSVCSPNTLTLTATGCAGIVTWSNNSTGTILTISSIGTYSISANCTETGTPADGCISEQSSTVSGLEIKAKPNSPTIILPEILSVCSPNTLTLTATGCAGIVTWSNNSTGTSLTISSIGTYTISANCSTNGCISEQSSEVSGLEIKVKPSPPTIISPNLLVVCSPNTLTLTATGCAGIVTWPNNATGTILTISEVGTYSISANCTQNSCISEQSSTVSGLEINAKPNPPTIISPENLSVCSPNTLTLTATGCAGIVTWSNNATGTILTISEVGTYSILANCIQNGCISEQSSVVSGLEIKAKPSPPTLISPNSLVVCSPNTLTLTATGCAGIVTWSNNATGKSLTISAVGTYAISANCTVNSCISEQSSTISGLEIKAKPNLIAESNSPICAGSILNLISSGGNTYSWAGPNGYSSTSQNLTFRNATSSLSGIYTITSIGTNGCSASISVAILVRATGRIYVNDNATGANNGKSWGDALTDLQAALDYPCSFDEIWVAGGIYKPSKDPLGNAFPENERWKTFYLQNGINLYGGFAGNETSLSQRTKSVIIANPSILSGDIGVFGNNADNVFHVLTSVNDDNTTLLDGFTITNGNANGYGEYQIVLENQTIYNHYGGGLCNNLSSPTIQNCTFYTNFSRSSGGGIYNENASPIIINCSFLNNTSDSGGGMYNTNSSPIVNNTIFSSNISLAGGAIYNVLSSNPFFTNCLFFANAANYVGGGIFNYLSSSTITNCTFFGNTAVNTGGGIYNIVNSNIIVKNSIFWKNEVNSNTNAIGVDIVNDAQGRSWVTYTSMQLPNNTTNYPVNGQIVGFQGDGVGNIYATDPLFTNDTDPDGNDNIFGTSDDGLALQSASPVINIGDPSINSPATDVTGFTRTLPFDLGAYEYSPCSVLLNLISTNDDYSTGTYQKLASSSAGKIIAINKITGTAKVTYKAKIIELNAGFKADSGTVFLAEVGGCN